MPELPDITIYIEALEQRIRGQILEQVRFANPFLLRTVDYVQVKGKTKPVTVYAVVGEREGAEVQVGSAWLQAYEDGVLLYRQRDFAGAAQHFAVSLNSKPDDVLSAIYRKRCAALLADPPDANWNGVYVMTKK